MSFLSYLLPNEHKILTTERVMDAMHSLISNRLYRPVYVGKSGLKDVFNDEDAVLTAEQLDEIIVNSPQQHKESGTFR
jgi:hypothetical protein